MKAFDYEDVQFFKSLARAMGLMIQRLKRMDELNLAIEMSGCVTANFMGSMRSLEQTYTCVLDGILSILKANQASLMILDKSRGVLVTTMIRGPYPHLDGGVEMPLEEGIPGRVLESCDPALTSELPRHKMGKGKKQPFKSYLCLPLLEIKGQPLGVLNVYSGQHARFFSVHDLNLASTYATRAALALENVLLHQRHSDSSKEATPEKGEKKAA